MKFFEKKEEKKGVWEKLSPGEFDVCLAVTSENASKKNPTLMKKKAIYPVAIGLLFVTFMAHSVAFFERQLVKNTLAPIVLVLTGLFYDTLFAAPAPPAKSPAPPPSPGAAGDTSKKDAPPKSGEEEPFDPLSLDEGKVKILLSLDQRAKELQKREDNLKTREALTIALETQVKKKAADLAELKKVIEDLSKIYNEAVSKHLKNLITTYEAMKPQIAGKFFDELPLPVLMELIQAMNPKKVSAIFESMNVDKVKAITDRIALMPKVPERSGK